MDHRQRSILASVAIVAIFLVVQVGAVAMVEPFQEAGHQEVENTDNPGLSIGYIVGILIATGLMLVGLKYGGQNILRSVIIFAVAYLSFFVFQIFAGRLLGDAVSATAVSGAAAATALALAAALYLYPEWYVIDAAGVLVGIGAAGLFGINLGIFPVIVLLGGLAVYDAISVYGTEHMLTLASGVMDMRVPVVFVIPLSLSYSFLDAEPPEAVQDETEAESDGGEPVDANEAASAEQASDEPAGAGQASVEVDEAETTPKLDPDEVDPEDIGAELLNDLGPDGIEANAEALSGMELDDEQRAELDEDVRERIEELSGERDAMFIGLGDAVMPTILVASAASFVEAGTALSVLGVSASLPVLTAMVGTLLGLVVLLWLVQQGRAHAGLPLLNGGAIAGYLLGALLSGLTLVEALGLTGFV
jgi:presenilin-like A22 family membrane protease